ncbi:MAG: HypC/HybG/HupF family hydrogenase formation chaperone [Actinomycetota bacterium]|nr:HypC/HybG/HupF family hydrogenase formation chaperone [Actinomycetota bacterium]
MCLAIPAKVIKIENNSAEVETLGVTKTVDITLIPEVKKDDYVLVTCRVCNPDSRKRRRSGSAGILEGIC